MALLPNQIKARNNFKHDNFEFILILGMLVYSFLLYYIYCNNLILSHKKEELKRTLKNVYESENVRLTIMFGKLIWMYFTYLHLF